MITTMYVINNTGYIVDLQWLYDFEVCLLKIDVSYGSQVNEQQCIFKQMLEAFLVKINERFFFLSFFLSVASKSKLQMCGLE